ncbi:YggS family pyridoxal phosphate-dependent enzyme [Endothiovibrio diazotrophicus]
MTGKTQTEPNEIAAHIAAVEARIRAAEARFGRPAGSVKLLAVSKTKPIEAVEAAYRAGLRAFGENYLQDALVKIETLKTLEDLEWHFIGPLQSNKTRPVAEHFHWLHTVDRLKIAQRLSDQRPAGMSPLNLCLQVNVSAEASKSGCSLEELPALAEAVAALPNLRLRGLMCIPARSTGLEAQRAPFRALCEAMERLNHRGLSLDTLSMGMSDDLEAAIAEGATLVRVGTALFGARDYGLKT